MTTKEVDEFLSVNRWRPDAYARGWIHPNISNTIILYKEIVGDPDKTFKFAVHEMFQRGMSIQPTNASLVQSQAQNNTTQNVPNLNPPSYTFNNNTGTFITPSAAGGNPISYSAIHGSGNVIITNDNNIIARKGYTSVESIKCDCGSAKCNLPHSHWCSTQMKGNSNGK